MKGKVSSISLQSLEEIEKEVQTEKQHFEKNKKDLSTENVSDFFTKIAKTANPPSTRIVLEHIKCSVKNGQIILVVRNAVDKSTILKETWIIEQLRKEFGDILQVTIEIDETTASLDAAPRPVSKKEMLDQMAQKNPAVKALAEKLSLRFDN